MADKPARAPIYGEVVESRLKLTGLGNYTITGVVRNAVESQTNTPPVCSIVSPTGLSVKPGASFQATITDIDKNINLASLRMWLVDALSVSTDIIVAGDFQTPSFNGTIELDAGTGTVTINVTTHPLLTEQAYVLHLYAADDAGGSDEATGGFTVVFPPPAYSDIAPTIGGSINDPNVEIQVVLCPDQSYPLDPTTFDWIFYAPDMTVFVALENGAPVDWSPTVLGFTCDGGYILTIPPGDHDELPPGEWCWELHVEDAQGTPLDLAGCFTVIGSVGRGSPLGLNWVYPITREMAAVGMVWRAEYINAHLETKNQATMVGPVSFVARPKGGAVLNGAAGLSYDGRSGPVAAFQSRTQFWAMCFTPEFEASAADTRTIFDSDQTGGTTNRVRKLADGSIEVVVSGTTFTVPLTSYQSYWRVNRRNTLVVSTTSGDTSIWLNRTKILDASATPYTIVGSDGMFSGVKNTKNSEYLLGTLHWIRLGVKTLTDADLPIVLGDDL